MSLGLTDKLKKSPKIKSVCVTEDKKISISWTKVDGAEKYAVKRSTQAGGDFETVAWAKKPEFVDDTADENITYWYKITAWKKLEGKKTSTKNSAVKAVVISDMPAAEKVSVKAGDKPLIKIKWKNIPGVDGCIINRRNDFFSQIIPVAVAEGESYTDDGIVPGQPYHYSLQYYKKQGEEILHGNFSDEYDCIYLDSGKILSCKAGAFGRIKLSLRLVAGADGYIISRKDDKSAEYEQVIKTQDGFNLHITDKVPKHFKRYTYRVCAYKIVNGKEYLSWQSAETGVLSI